MCEIAIEKEPFITETWYKGTVIYEEQTHPFWFINTEENIEEELKDGMSVTAPRIEWWYKRVPMKVRHMEDKIINEFKTKIL